MTDVTLSAALRANLLSLQNTSTQTAKVQLALATGKKVNSALDNPNAFFASQSLTDRANDLSNLLDGIGQAVQSLQTANQGITSLTSLIQQAQAVAQNAQDETTGGALAYGANLTAGQAADLSSITGLAAGDDVVISDGVTGDPTHTFALSSGETLQDLADQINNTVPGTTASVVAGTTAGTTRIRLQTTDGSNIEIKDGATSVTNSDTTAATIFGTAGSTAGVTTTATGVSAPKDQASLEQSYDTILSQINSLVKDANYRGVALLDNGSLTVNFNEDNSSSLTVAGVDFSSSGLGLDNADFSSGTAISASLTALTGALNTVRAQGSTFGSNLTIIQARQDFTNDLINTLQTGSDALTNADQNEEGAELLALQTQQSLGTTSLSLASQANQSILRLFS